MRCWQMAHDLESDGFAVLPGVARQHQLNELLALVMQAPRPIEHPSGVPFASRALLETVPRLNQTLQSTGITAIASAQLGLPAFPVDAIFLDKSVEANWTVPAHQDRVFPVADDSEGKHRIRDGVPYAEPDALTLGKLLALRIHFDPTDSTSGALCFVPGSHRDGVLSDAAIRRVPIAHFVPCPANVGDVVMMCPLTLHRSSPSQSQSHRRVLHVVYSTQPPSNGLNWRYVTNG
jgi:hypothetical protein